MELLKVEVSSANRTENKQTNKNQSKQTQPIQFFPSFR